MTDDEAKQQILTDPDFVYSKRFNFSLEKLMDRYVDGPPKRIQAQVLMITENELEEIYEQAIQKLRKFMNVNAL